MRLVTVTISGDLVPTRSNADFFASGEVDRALDEKLLETLMAADARVINLEAPLTDRPAPIRKAGPALSAPSACVRGLKALEPVLALSNNHVLDQGASGLRDTVRVLETAGIPFGRGRNPSRSWKTLYSGKKRPQNRRDGRVRAGVLRGQRSLTRREPL